MKNARKFVIFIVIFSLMLMNLAYADPIDDIIDTSPGTTTFNDLTSPTYDKVDVADVSTGGSGAADWIVQIFNTIIGIVTTGAIYPIFAVLGIDHIAKIIFNYEPLVRLSFFEDTASANVGMAHGLMDAIAPIYVAFRYIAIICYVAIILYLAIRMLLSTVGKQKAMYKELIKIWVTGVMILLTFNWLMTYTIVLSDTLVEILANSVGYNSSTPEFLSNSLGGFSTVMGMGILAAVYVLCLLGMTIAVWWTYIKRLFTIALLIMVFPLVTITYVFDKIGDRKSQILGAWTREFMTNVFVQPIQAIALILIMMAMKETNGMGLLIGPIIRMILLFMLFPAEKLLKKIFDVNPGINGGGFSGAGAGMVGGLMMAKSAIPVLKNNVSNFRDARNAKAALSNAERDFAKGKIDGNKLAEAQKNARAASLKRLEAVTGTAGIALGAGATGSLSKGLGVGAAADLLTGWGADKAGNKAAKNGISETYNGLKSGIDNGNLTDAQKKQIASRLGISTSELDRTLANDGGKKLVKDQLESEKLAALAHMKTGAAAAEFERNKFKDSMKLDANGNFKEIRDGQEIAAGKLGQLKVSRNNITALDTDGNIKMNLLDSNGKAFKHASFSDDKEVNYDFDISGPAGPVVLCDAQKEKAESTARRKTLESARLEDASEAEQIAYLESNDGQKHFTRKYEAEVDKEVKIVEELREATGMQNLQVTNMTVSSSPASPAPASPAPAPVSPTPGATIPQGAPVAAAPVNVDELTRAISSAFQSSMSSVATSMSSSMSGELKSVIDDLKNNMKNVTPGSGNTVTLDGDIRSMLSGVSDEMARTLQTAANDYTKAVNDAQKSAANYLQQFGLKEGATNDAHTDLKIRFSEETSRQISEARRKAGLDAI